MALEAYPSAHTRLAILGYFVDGAIKLPGSLTREEFETDPWGADPKSVSRDEKRITTKGRIGIRYNATFGGNLNNEIEITSYGTLKFFERTAKDYRIITRYGLGINARYVNKTEVDGHSNEFSVGGDLYAQPARTEYYENISGQKGDQIQQIESENITNKGFYISNNFEILPKRFFLLLTGRYDDVNYDQTEETLPSRTDKKPYKAFTPKIALNYKLSDYTALFTSYGLSFDAPAANEMGSPDPEYLFNKDLKPQESDNFEVGLKGNLLRYDQPFLRRLTYEATFYFLRINNEIVPYEVLGEVFYRNAAKTNRRGVELGAQTELAKNLNFGLTYTLSVYDYLTYEAEVIEEDSLGNLITTTRDFSGNVVPSVPLHNLYLSLAYTLPFGKHHNGFARVSYQGISGMWVDDANTDKTKGYNLLNFTAGADLRFGRFNLMASAGVNNIFDQTYVGFTNTNSSSKRYYEAGAPRDFFVSLNLGYLFN
jgi:iron complex outermembrane receptor protein